jgi:hypothetical protein
MAYDAKYGHVTVDGDTGEESGLDRAAKFNTTEEPVFILRGQDIHAVPTIARYQALIEATDGHDPEVVQKLDEVLKTISEWQTDNHDRVKLAD